MAKIIDGKAIAAQIRQEISAEVVKIKEETGKVPGLAVIIVGQDPASQVYVRNKKKDCDETGINSRVYALPEQTTEEELLALVHKLNNDDDVHGIIVQLPLPKHLNSDLIINNIDVSKDVDAFHPYNVGKIMIGDYELLPCTPAGIMALLERSNIDVAGKNCVVVGRSNIVGKPQAMMLLHKNGTVTICHSKTKNLADVCRSADILVVAIGRAKFITGDMIKEGAVVIDVGMCRDENGKLCGDVDYESAEKKASYITPVPGGVGPMTRVMLLQNTLSSAKKKIYKK